MILYKREGKQFDPRDVKAGTHAGEYYGLFCESNYKDKPLTRDEVIMFFCSIGMTPERLSRINEIAEIFKASEEDVAFETLYFLSEANLPLKEILYRGNTNHVTIDIEQELSDLYPF